jgi:hypothetical protein
VKAPRRAIAGRVEFCIAAVCVAPSAVARKPRNLTCSKGGQYKSKARIDSPD